MTTLTPRSPATKSASGVTTETRDGLSEANPAQVDQWLRSGEAVLIDVREPDEHAREHIRGARLAPLSAFDAGAILASARAGQRVVLHCRSGRRSSDACRVAMSVAGNRVEVFTMSGGIEAWKSLGLPVEVDVTVSRISVMRQVQLVIGLAVLGGSALAWFVDPLFVGIPAFFGAGLTIAGASGTCALASLVSKMPWNRTTSRDSCCKSGSCG